jgi:CubicO group peptidase (beta-lactamase class C family)
MRPGKSPLSLRTPLFAAAGTLLLTLGTGSILYGQTIDIDRVVAELDPAIAVMMIEGRVPSATVALVAGDEIVWAGAYGHSNRWARTPAVPSTVYLIGSTFKAMSTVALLRQMELGKFELDDRVNDYLTELEIRGEDPSNPVTFRHLLTHTSGLPTVFDPYPLWDDSVPPLIGEYLRDALEVVGPPMDSLRYSNMAYTLVAHLVEKFSGTPYKEYIQQYVWDPLEMTSTAFAPTPDMQQRLAIPYVFEEEAGAHKPAPQLRAPIWPAGLVYGTVLDQANWLIANLNGGVFKEQRIIGDTTLADMHTRQYDKFTGPISRGFGNEATGYGLTWWVSERGGERYFAHSGSVPGYTAFLLGNRDRKLGFAVLTNDNRAHQYLIKLAEQAIDLLVEHSRSP